MPVNIPGVSTGQGPSYTLDQLRKNPSWIMQIAFKLAENTFIADYICRKGPPAVGGAIAFQEAQPLFSNTEPDIIAEFAEIPSTDSHIGGFITRATTKRGYGVRMSQEMIDRMDSATFARNLQQAINTMKLSFDRLCFDNFKQHPRIPHMVSSTVANTHDGWLGATTGIRKDVADALFLVKAAHSDNSADERFMYNPDTLVVHPALTSAWIDNDEINRVFMASPEVTEAPRYKFVFPRKFFGLNIVESYEMPVDSDGIPTAALLLQKGETAFISDERAFRTTPLYEDKKTESWRSDMTRISTMGVDNPYSALWITGINGAISSDGTSGPAEVFPLSTV
jgi:hypothetical protein